MGKNIVLCLDGTWNGPNSADKDGNQTPTNVLAPPDEEKEFALSMATAWKPVLRRLAGGKVPVQLGPVDGSAYRPKNLTNSYLMLDWSGAAPHVVVEP